MSVRRPSVASEHSAVLSDHNSVLSPAKSAKTASVAEQSVEPTRQYASSITSSQMTHETMDYTNDDRSTHTAQVQQMVSLTRLWGDTFTRIRWLISGAHTTES